ncbi:MAG TPA: hypothetical protein DD724_06375 [Lactobacillus acetotolerans]|jgi:hypothetical protein|nr:hypothetical protein [Lactobacillus acetotolerans]
MILENVVPNKLHQELIDAGVNCIVLHNLKDGRYVVGECEVQFFGDVDMTAVQAVIDAHNPEPLPSMPTKVEIIEQELANTNALILELTEIILGGM